MFMIITLLVQMFVALTNFIATIINVFLKASCVINMMTVRTTVMKMTVLVKVYTHRVKNIISFGLEQILG